MSKLEDLIEDYKGRINACDDLLSEKAQSPKTIDRLKTKRGCYRTTLSELESLTSSHREEIEKAYKAGEGDGAMVAMFPSTDNPPLVRFKDASDYYEKTFGTKTPDK